MDSSGGSARPSPGTIERRRGTIGLPRSEVSLRDAEGRARQLTVVHLDDGGRFATELESRRLLPRAIAALADLGGGSQSELPVVLLPDLANTQDPNAVAVCAVGGEALGHLPREASALWQPALIRLFNSCDVHVSCPARVRAGLFPRVRLDVSLPLVQRLLDELRQASDDRIALETMRADSLRASPSG